jgi:hypothetical protein
MSTSTGAARSRSGRLRAEPRSLPRLSVVPPRVANARSGPFVLLVAAILVLGLVGLLLLNLSMQKASFRLAALETKAEQLQTREQSLDHRVDRLSSSDRLAAEAIRLGMVPNPNPVFLDLSDGSVIGDPVAARPRPETSPTETSRTDTSPTETSPGANQPTGSPRGDR